MSRASAVAESPTTTVKPYAGVCYLVLAHNDPEHVRRLVAAVDPAPVVLHCDARTADNVYREMLAGGERVVPLPRRPTPWGGWQAAAAELDGIHVALAGLEWDHLVVLQGSDYPLAAQPDVAETLSGLAGRSVSAMQRLPRRAWSGHGGLDRLRYRHWVVRRHMLRLPIRRRLPERILPTGGSVNKVLCREHAQLIVGLAAARPDLARFWRRCWAPDETFVQTLLQTAVHDAGRGEEIVERSLWFTDWGRGGRSPEWLTAADQDTLVDAAHGEQAALFARKFSTSASGSLLDFVDGDLRG